MIAMDSRTLNIFRCVAETGSLTAAARQLHTVQSNVTAHIKRLEEEIGLPLFHRKPRGVALTPAGEVLQDYAVRIARLLDEAGRAVRQAGDSLGPLRVGTLESLAAARLPPVLARFRHALPEVDLQLVTGSTEQLAAEVLGYRLDGAFVAGAVAHPDIDYRQLHEEELVLVSEAGRQQRPALSREVLLAFRRGCAFRARAELWLREEGQLPLRTMEFGALDAILGCVAAGMGVTVLPRVVVERPQYREQLAIHTLPARYAHMATGFIRRRDMPAGQALEELVKLAAA
jgi:DNA-binding transcriptional LysR family regulator